jgi:tellurite resistance protein
MSLTLPTALISTMVMVSAADKEMSDRELYTIGQIVRTLPAFNGYEPDDLAEDASESMNMLNAEENLEAMIGKIKAALPKKLWETAYALACDVAVADGHTGQEELRMLELLRHELEVDRLSAAAIERGSAVRFTRL